MAKKTESIGDATIADITRLLEHHRAAATVLENTLRLMTGVQHTLFAPAVPAFGNGHSEPKAKRRRAAAPTPAEEKTSKREATSRFLGGFDRSDARTVEAVASDTGSSSAMGPLVHHGYLKPKGDGYVRTAKEFEV